MIDMLLHSAYPGRHFSGFFSGRCPRCTQGMIVSSDGFMMVRCDNCGRYLANESYAFGFGLRPITTALKDFVLRAKRRVAAHVRKSAATSTLQAAEGA
jgi:ribosomal protein S27E